MACKWHWFIRNQNVLIQMELEQRPVLINESQLRLRDTPMEYKATENCLKYGNKLCIPSLLLNWMALFLYLKNSFIQDFVPCNLNKSKIHGFCYLLLFACMLVEFCSQINTDNDLNSFYHYYKYPMTWFMDSWRSTASTEVTDSIWYHRPITTSQVRGIRKKQRSF